MFVYTVYGAPGVTRREPLRRVEPVSPVGETTTVHRTWAVRRNQADPVEQSPETRTAQGHTYQQLAYRAQQETREPRAGDFHMQLSPDLVLQHRGVKSVLPPNFSGALQQLRSAVSKASGGASGLSSNVREDVRSAPFGA